MKVAQTSDESLPASRPGEPTWEVALLFPEQGSWTEEEYLALDQETNRMIELSDGCLEFLPMPDLSHQFIARFLFRKLDAFTSARKQGETLFAPLPTRLWPGKFREPDVIYLRRERLRKRKTRPDEDDLIERYPQGAELVMEVVSPGKKARKRDLRTKRREYAKAGIAEYWIIDPQRRHVRVLSLKGTAYRVQGTFGRGTVASSVLLAGFSVSVDEVFAAGEHSK